MRITLLAVAMTFVHVTASAQHPCDLQVPESYVLNSNESVSIGFCHSGSDDLGQPATDFQIVLPDRTVSVGIPPKLTALPNGEGLYLYETAPLSIRAAGSVSVRAVRGSDVSLPSSPIVVTFTLPPPPVPTLRAPSGVRFWRQ